MDAHLEGRVFLELGHPTIADIAGFPYVAMAEEGEVCVREVLTSLLVRQFACA